MTHGGPEDNEANSIWSDALDRLVEQLEPELVAVRRQLHVHPEPSGQERQTTQFLAERLARAGFRVRLGPEGRGVITDLAAAGAAPGIALRADMDALLLHDAKEVDYRSQVPGVMHGCGHDAHSAIVLGTLLALRRADEAGCLPVPVRVRGIFQPAEETNRGALEMIAAGALENIQAILALHVDPSREVGRIGVRDGAFTATCDEMEIRIEGRGGHAARPHESIDPIAAAAQLISSIYLFVPRGVDSHDPVVVTIGQVTGGHSFNVIPAEVLLRGTLRTLGKAIRGGTKDHIRQLARGLQEASGARIHVAFSTGPGSVHNDRALGALFRQAGAELLGPDKVEDIPRPSMGGEDFAHYLDHVPGCMFRLGCGKPGQPQVPLHAPNFDIDERALVLGAKILARTVVLWSLRRRQEQP